MDWPRRILLFVLPCGLVLLVCGAPSVRADDGPPPPRLIFPFPEGQTWRITCGYALPDDADTDACGHSGKSWNRYALDFQHVGGAEAAKDQPVRAAAAGEVSRAGWHAGLGWHVILDHGSGYSTVYGHMREPPVVQEGDEVPQGRTLGYVGCTGTCTGPHIHFALWKDGTSVLPEPMCGHRGLSYGQLLAGCSPLASAGADFDGDKRHDLAFFYEYGEEAARIHLLTSDGVAFDYSGPEGWWRVDQGFRLRDVVHALAGDFDGDGRTDLAALVDEHDCAARLDVFLAKDGHFAEPEAGGWWASPAYCARRTPFAASGDFDGDGLADIAFVYRINIGETRIDVLRSDGTRFVAAPEGWWQSEGYWPGRVAQVLPGDFDGDGRTDLAALYDYADCQSRVHVFLSTGRDFQYSGPEAWWRSYAFCAAGVRHAASGDFDGDGLADDLAFLQEESAQSSRIYVLRSDCQRFVEGEDFSWWEEEADEEADVPAGEVRALLRGDFDGDGLTDLAALRNDGECFARVQVFASQGDSFQPADWWATRGYCVERVWHAVP